MGIERFICRGDPGFYSGGARPSQIFLGGPFNSREGISRSNYNPKNHHFSDDFPVIFWYIRIILLL